MEDYKCPRVRLKLPFNSQKKLGKMGFFQITCLIPVDTTWPFDKETKDERTNRKHCDAAFKKFALFTLWKERYGKIGKPHQLWKLGFGWINPKIIVHQSTCKVFVLNSHNPKNCSQWVGVPNFSLNWRSKKEFSQPKSQFYHWLIDLFILLGKKYKKTHKEKLSNECDQ